MSTTAPDTNKRKRSYSPKEGECSPTPSERSDSGELMELRAQAVLKAKARVAALDFSSPADRLAFAREASFSIAVVEVKVESAHGKDIARLTLLPKRIKKSTLDKFPFLTSGFMNWRMGTTPIGDEVFKHLVGLSQVRFEQTVTAADGRPLLKLKTLPARGDPIPPVKVTVLGTFATTGRHLFQRAADNVTEPNLTAEVARAAFGSAPYAKNVAFTDTNFYARFAGDAEVWNTLPAIQMNKRGRERARALGSRVFLNTAGSNKEQWGLQHADALETATNLSANLGVMAVLIKNDGKDELHIFAPHLSALTRWRGAKATLQNLPKTIDYLEAVVCVFDALDAANPRIPQHPLPDTTGSRFWPLMHEQLNKVFVKQLAARTWTNRNWAQDFRTSDQSDEDSADEA
ncbi:hypothetical protein OC835_004457 [Tilletia horrida]|nr:hypothetical protein OC835_004457 [Tilletia horrida]